MRRAHAALAASLLLCACASPQRLPVALSLCNSVAVPGGLTVTASVQNTSDKPISSLGLALSFYRNFRYANYSAFTRLSSELDPGQRRDVTFDVRDANAQAGGQAVRCTVTHIGYLDGTSQDLPISQ